MRNCRSTLRLQRNAAAPAVAWLIPGSPLHWRQLHISFTRVLTEDVFFFCALAFILFAIRLRLFFREVYWVEAAKPQGGWGDPGGSAWFWRPPPSSSAIIYRSIIFQGTPSSGANLAGCRPFTSRQGHILGLVQTAANPRPTYLPFPHLCLCSCLSLYLFMTGNKQQKQQSTAPPPRIHE